MNVLVIDRDALTNQLIAARLTALGHHVQVFQNKNDALGILATQNIDCILFDPAPVSEARLIVFALWKALQGRMRPYLTLLSKSSSTEDAVLSGANDVLNKPLDSHEIDVKIANAARLIALKKMLAIEDNVHSAAGVIGKAAFHQLFLSAIDRAFRYAERSLVVFIQMHNHDDIVATAGAEIADSVVKKLNEKMTYMRRQSDVIGRLSTKDFAILLQRPQSETEPLDAISRFSETLDKFRESFEDKAIAPVFKLQLVEIPQGALRAEMIVPASYAKTAEGSP